jgi:TonB-like protein
MASKLIYAFFVAATILAIGAIDSTIAQQETWQRIAPVGQSFTILMPTRAVEAFRGIQINEKDYLPARVYYSLSGGKRYAVLELYKTPPEIVPALSTYENFVAAMERSLTSDDAKSLTFDRDVSVEGATGKQYHVKLGAYSGVARFLGTSRAFYALVVIGAEESDSNVVRFLSSLVLGEVNTSADSSGLSGTSVLTRAGSASEASDRPNGSLLSARQGVTAQTRGPEDLLPPEQWPQPVGPIMGGVLNGKAIHLVVPQYPAAARVARESGAIQVQVLIDELGNVIRAQALTGPPRLREAAAAAAWKSRFTPTRLMGQPVRVNGIIIYNFVP